MIDKAVAPTCTATGLTEGKHCDACGKVIVAQETVKALGHDMMIDKEAVAPTCTATGLTEGSHCTKCDHKVAQDVVEKLPHTVVVDKAVEATCTTEGKTEGSHCSVCETVLKAQNTIPADHNFVDGVCTKCGIAQTKTTVKIQDYATANGWVNSTQYKTLEVDRNVVITITNTGNNNNSGKYYTNGNNWRIYQNENPAIKFTALNGATIISVKITYSLANTGTLTLNGSSKNSGTVVNVNASTVTFSVGNTGTATNGNIQITAIEVVYAGGIAPCGHITDDTLWGEGEITTAATCLFAGIRTYTCSSCEEEKTEEIPATGHNYENGECTNCGEKEITGEVAAAKTKYTFSSYTAGTQYAQGEKHVLDSNTTLIINGAHLNSQVRLYSGSNAVIESKGTVSKITVKAGYKAGTLTINVSTDGKTWTKVKAISTTTTYTDYTVELNGSYKYIQLVSSGAQIRVSELTINP